MEGTHPMKIERAEWWQVDQFVHIEMVNSPEYAELSQWIDPFGFELVRVLYVKEAFTAGGSYRHTDGQRDPEHSGQICVFIHDIPLRTRP